MHSNRIDSICSHGTPRSLVEKSTCEQRAFPESTPSRVLHDFLLLLAHADGSVGFTAVDHEHVTTFLALIDDVLARLVVGHLR